MAEIRTVTTLQTKADEIRSSILNYEKRLAQARADLSHVNACIAMFKATGDRTDMQPYVDLHRLFKRGEPMALCKEALAAHGSLNTRQLAQHVVKAKGLDGGDKVLARTVALQLVQALRQQAKRGTMLLVEKRHGISVWKLPNPQ